MTPRADRMPRRRLDPGQRRAVILDVATRAFAAAPFAEVSVGAIGAEAGASEALVHKYFESKAGLYAEVLGRELDALAERQSAAVADLEPGVPARDQVRAMLLVQLDALADPERGWASPLRVRAGEPGIAVALRERARHAWVDAMSTVLAPDQGPRQEYALWGYVGFVSGGGARWLARGCPQADRWLLAESALGALEGALGDWGR